jgi:hypothetical protein
MVDPLRSELRNTLVLYQIVGQELLKEQELLHTVALLKEQELLHTVALLKEQELRKEQELLNRKELLKEQALLNIAERGQPHMVPVVGGLASSRDLAWVLGYNI